MTALPSVEVVSFGCRLNHVESAAIERVARASSKAGLVVFNTCSVTAESVRQARQAIRRLERERPGVEIVVTGCGSETEPQKFLDLPGVTRLIPNAVKAEAAAWSAESPLPSLPKLRPIADVERTRAFVQVQNGCDHSCTFCIIPAGRGRARSVPISEAVAEIARLVDSGVPEVVLTGVDLTSWGADLEDGLRLGHLVEAILAGVPDLMRLRLSSIDSIEADDRLIDLFGGDTRLLPHMHLSLQAGDDLILKRMKRRHSFADAVAFCERMRRVRPEMVFGADIIAGFPTETEEMFQRSIDLVNACGLTHLHVFPFSPRPGTPAARIPPVPASIVKERAARLRAAGAVVLERHLQSCVGKNYRVLTEKGGMGRTDDFTPVRLADAVEAGQLVDVAIGSHDGRHLIAVDTGNRLVAAATAG